LRRATNVDMSNLRIVDLHRADELSASGMQQVAGGMSCDQALGACVALSFAY
jgi:hypothetical protein